MLRVREPQTNGSGCRSIRSPSISAQRPDRYATTTRLGVRDLSALLTDAGGLVVPADTYADLEIAESFSGGMP